MLKCIELIQSINVTSFHYSPKHVIPWNCFLPGTFKIKLFIYKRVQMKYNQLQVDGISIVVFLFN